MNSYLLSFPVAEFGVVAPEALDGLLRTFYPRAVVEPESRRFERTDAVFTVASDGGHWTLADEGELEHRFSSALQALSSLEYEIENRLVRRPGDHVVFHAGAVVLNGERDACLLAGASEAGKTSSTVQLVELGHEFLADELAFVDVKSGCVMPYSQTPSVDSGFVDEFGSQFELRAGVFRELGDSVTRYLPSKLASMPSRVTHLLLPRYRPGHKTAVVELGPGDALTEVLGYCFQPTVEPEAFLELVISLLDGWSIKRITYGNAGEAREALSRLFKSP